MDLSLHQIGRDEGKARKYSGSDEHGINSGRCAHNKTDLFVRVRLPRLSGPSC